MNTFSPGMRILCRDADWLVTHVAAANQRGDQQVVYCIGADELTRGHQAAFLTQPDPALRDYDADDIKPFFLMRFKEDVRNEAGEHFASRRVVPLDRTSISATAAEESVYRRLAEIRQRVLDRTLGSNAIVQWGMYKSFLSSPEACRSTARKRHRQLSVEATAGNRVHANPEIEALAALLSALDGLDISASARYRLLLRELDSMGWDGTPASPRLLLFTESRVTQQHLSQALARHFGLGFSAAYEDQPNQTLAVIHGAMPDIALSACVEAFGIGTSPVRMLVATDVASEGVNLHHQCHHIIHYDLPWSIITLIQRNGRIDRFGQRHDPIIRYLMVRTEQGLLEGDQAIFGRLVDKVEEINRSTRTGESVLELYDAKKEEEYIARAGVMAGNSAVFDHPAGGQSPSGQSSEADEAAQLEATLRQAGSQGHDDFLAALLGEGEPADPEATAETESKPGNEATARGATLGNLPADSSRVRLMDDADFLRRGYRTLAQTLEDQDYPPLQHTAEQIIINPPQELKRRLGAPDAAGDLVFGATAIPEEAWPEDRQLYVSTDPKRIDRAIAAALAQKGQWSRELLLTEQHPVMQWLAERLMTLMRRGEAPLIASPFLTPGELRFCFIGQVSSRAGTPLIVDPHAVSIRKGGEVRTLPLKQALEQVRFEQLTNTGRATGLNPDLLSGMVTSAVEESLRHLQALREQRTKAVRPRLKAEETRLQHWFDRWGKRIEDRLATLPPEGKRAVQLRRQRADMEMYLEDRKRNWEEAHFLATEAPTTRLVLAVEGVSR